MADPFLAPEETLEPDDYDGAFSWGVDRGEIQQRLVSIDDVERRAGLDFLSGLLDATEDALEAVVGLWPLPGS